MTLDGINIQDNFIRTNSLDFLPNRPTSDNVAEFSITTSVSGADTAGGATSVRMVTPSGTNRFTGSAFEFNRDAKFAANSFFNNASNVAKPDLSRHQFGGRVGGPIQRNKLFFFGYYEGFRQTTQTAQNLTIPANPICSTACSATSATDGVVQCGQRHAAVGPARRSEAPSPTSCRRFPAPSNVNNFDAGNSTATRVLNTAGYRFNQTDLNNRDQYSFRVDYSLTDKHRFEGIYSYFKETDDRTDLDFISPDRPLVFTNSDAKRFSLAWRWLASAELPERGARRRQPRAGAVQQRLGVPRRILYNTALSIINPIGGNGTGRHLDGFQPQGRYTNTYQIGDSASSAAGHHQLQMGGSWQRNHVNPYNFAGRSRQVTFGFSTAAPASVQLTSAQFPGGISAAELANANALASWLGGIVSSVAQTFQVQDTELGIRRRDSRRTRTTRSTTSPRTCRTTGAGSRTSPFAPD